MSTVPKPRASRNGHLPALSVVSSQSSAAGATDKAANAQCTMDDGQTVETADGRRLTRDQWLLERDKNFSIGASDIPKIVGLTGSAVKLHYEKRGMIAPDYEPSEQAWWGKELEALIMKRWSIVTGETLVATQVFLRHPEHPWLCCTLDCLNADGDIREIKSLSLYGKDDGDAFLKFDPANPPSKWIVQAQAQMEITDEEEVKFPVFYGPEMSLKQCVVRRDRDMWALIFAEVQAFRQGLIDGVPPTEFKPDDASVLSKVFRGTDGPDITSDDPELVRVTREHHQARVLSTAIEKKKDTTRAVILQRMGNSTSALIGGYEVSRKVTKTGVRLDVKPPATDPDDGTDDEAAA